MLKLFAPLLILVILSGCSPLAGSTDKEAVVSEASHSQGQATDNARIDEVLTTDELQKQASKEELIVAEARVVPENDPEANQKSLSLDLSKDQIKSLFHNHALHVEFPRSDVVSDPEALFSWADDRNATVDGLGASSFLVLPEKAMKSDYEKINFSIDVTIHVKADNSGTLDLTIDVGEDPLLEAALIDAAHLSIVLE